MREAMASLDTHPNLASPDDVYAMLVDAHRDLGEAQSQRVNVRLVLLLANHVGDVKVIGEAIAAARRDVATADEARATAAQGTAMTGDSPAAAQDPSTAEQAAAPDSTH